MQTPLTSTHKIFAPGMISITTAAAHQAKGPKARLLLLSEVPTPAQLLCMFAAAMHSITLSTAIFMVVPLVALHGSHYGRIISGNIFATSIRLRRKVFMILNSNDELEELAHISRLKPLSRTGKLVFVII